MRYLLDTHILVWTLFQDFKLPREIYEIINNPNNDIFYSVASVWEISIKHAKTPEKMPVSSEMLVNYSNESGFESLPIASEHVFMLDSLSRFENAPSHKDPFDRILIAQAKSEGMILLTHDHLLKDYGESCVRNV